MFGFSETIFAKTDKTKIASYRKNNYKILMILDVFSFEALIFF